MDCDDPPAAIPAPHRDQTPPAAAPAAVLAGVVALVALALAARYVRRRRRRTAADRKKRLSDESWVSPILGSPRRKPVPADAEFGLAISDPVRVPSPVYISPFSPSPSLSSSSSSLSATPSPARLSCLLSSTFRDTRVARPTTAHLIQTARAYAHAYRPSSATTSLYTPPTPSARLSSFCPGTAAWGRVRDTLSTVTTLDTDAVPHLLHAVQPSISPFADPDPRNGNGNGKQQSTLPTGTDGQAHATTPVGLKLRLSDANEHARYRLRERERQLAREHAKHQQSTDSRTSESTARVVHQSLEVEMEEKVQREFKLRDSESVLREIGW